jgi:hypothetical protein
VWWVRIEATTVGWMVICVGGRDWEEEDGGRLRWRADEEESSDMVRVFSTCREAGGEESALDVQTVALGF